ncbi:MAG: esterase-like activity of phytase family protein [Fretibacterium sp.]|nr:esterase-like activity of phytase family protein [Fretibacterium sp.]
MKTRFAFCRLFALSGMMVLSTFGVAGAAEVQVQKHVIKLPESTRVSYDGAFPKAFPKGFELGIGSGLTFCGASADGGLLFLAISDRGPNADAPAMDSEGKLPAKIFPAPDFTPQIGLLKLKDGVLSLEKVSGILNGEGKPISGRPLPAGQVGTTNETPLDDNLKVLPFDPEGLDTEGIDVDRKDGHYWICDEYGPFIAKIDKDTGRILKKYAPGDGLPEVVKYRRPNRGMEGLAVSPSNKVFGIVQSPLDLGQGLDSSKARFIRLVELDPDTGKTRMFAYPHNVETYKKTSDAKIGDLAAIDDSRFLLVEQGKNKDGAMTNLLYEINIEGATDIQEVRTAAGQELETADEAELKELGVAMISKRLVVDLKAIGWDVEKAEGIALIDAKTIALCSDNDFGVDLKLLNPEEKDGKAVKKITDYNLKDGKLFLGEQETKTSFELVPLNEEQQFWLLTLPEPLF